MPGRPQYRLQSSKTFKLSADRLGYMADSGIAGIPIGVLFSLAGLLILGMIPFSWIHPFLTSSENCLTEFFRVLFAEFCILLIGAGCLFGGHSRLFLLRSTIDRKKKTVTTRVGWLGLDHKNYSFDKHAVSTIKIVNRPLAYYSYLDSIFCVSLNVENGLAIPLAYASSREAAETIQMEICIFLR